MDFRTFQHAEYDSESDVLYLALDGPRPGYGKETPEGHVIRYDERGQFYGLTLIGVKESFDKLGRVRVTAR